MRNYKEEHKELICELKKMRKNDAPVEVIIERLLEETDKCDSIIWLNNIGLDDISIAPWDEMGRLYIRNNELYEAEKLYRALLKKAYEDREKYGGVPIGLPYNNLGIVYEKRRNIAEAKRCYQRSNEFMVRGGTPNNVAKMNLEQMRKIEEVSKMNLDRILKRITGNATTLDSEVKEEKIKLPDIYG